MITSPLLTPFLKNDRLLMLALDHRGSFENIMGMKEKSPEEISRLIETKSKLIACLYPAFSGVLVDQQYGLPAIEMVNKNIPLLSQKPYLLCIEKTGYEEKNHERETILEYSVSDLVKKDAKGVKILLFFNPHAKNAEIQFNTAKKVLAECKKNAVPFFLELVTYPIAGIDTSGENLVAASVTYFLERDTIPDVFKLEFPGDSDSCGRITSLLEATPWILLSKGEPFDKFLEHVSIASKEGCSGFLAGRSIWQEINQHSSENLDAYLKDTVLKRFLQIVQAATIQD